MKRPTPLQLEREHNAAQTEKEIQRKLETFREALNNTALGLHEIDALVRKHEVRLRMKPEDR